MNPLVTTIIPAYNASKYLSETIKSVLSQTFLDFELLVIDDGSTDNTCDIVLKFSKADKRVKLISQQNRGVSAARNIGIENAQGEFIAFLDADDLWLPNKLFAQIEHLKHNPKLGASFGTVEFITSEGKSTGYCSKPRYKKLTPQYLYGENPAITPSNVVFRRDTLISTGGFDQDLKGPEDLELLLRICCLGWKIEGIERVLIQYRTNLDGVSSQLQKMEAEWERMSLKIRTYAPDLYDNYYLQARAIFLRYLARRTVRLGLDPKVGINFMNRAFKSDLRILLKEPKRTILTSLIVYCRYISHKIFEQETLI